MAFQVPEPSAVAALRKRDLRVRVTTVAALAVILVVCQLNTFWLSIAAIVMALLEGPLLGRTAQLSPRLRFGAMCLIALVSAAPLAVGSWMLWQAGDTARAHGLAMWCLLIANAVFDSHRLGPLRLAAAAPAATLLFLTPLMGAISEGAWDAAIASSLIGITGLGLALMAWRRKEARQHALRARLARAERDESLNRLLLDNSPLSAALLDTEFRIIAASQRFRRRHAQQQDEFLGRRFAEIIPDAQTHWIDALTRSLAGEHVRCSREEIVSTSGRIYYARWETRPWIVENQICGVVVFSENITSLVQAEQERREAELRLDVALSSSGSSVWEIDFSARTLAADQRFADLLGRTPTYKLVCSAEAVHPEDRDHVLALIERARANPGRHHTEHRIRRPDGSIKWCASTARSLPVPEGHKGRLVVMTYDITDRKRLELEFSAAMAQAEDTLEARHSVIEALAAETGQTMPAMPETAATLPTEDGPMLATFSQLHARLAVLLQEINLRDQVLFQAVEALRTAREEAQSASGAKTRFLADVSHELRTPLNAVIGYAEILSEELAETNLPQSADDAARIVRAARQLQGLINGILDLSKIEAGRMDILARPIDVRQLVDECVEIASPSAALQGNRMVALVPQEDLPLETDPLKLRQCLLNLLSNAAKFTENGLIQLQVRRLAGQGQVAFEVSDTGCGMTPGQVAKLFQPFAQVDEDHDRRARGTGLGLAITKRIAQLLGGDVNVHSTPGAGSTFTLTVCGRMEGLRAA